MDTYAGNNEDPLSLHKYLYAEDDPVNHIDPSGHENIFTVSLSLSTIAIISAIALPVTIEAGLAIRNHLTGSTVNPVQQIKFEDARNFITQKWPSVPGNYAEYENTAMDAEVRVHHPLLVRGEPAWGGTQEYGQWAGNVIHVDQDSFLLDSRLLASLLIHESVHAHQWDLRSEPSETQAYQVQSDVLRAWGLTANSVGDLAKVFPGDENFGFADEVSLSFQQYHITNPAWKQ
jgi:hypothetical protein